MRESSIYLSEVKSLGVFVVVIEPGVLEDGDCDASDNEKWRFGSKFNAMTTDD
jgi:hypothetical protein